MPFFIFCRFLLIVVLIAGLAMPTHAEEPATPPAPEEFQENTMMIAEALAECAGFLETIKGSGNSSYRQAAINMAVRELGKPQSEAETWINEFYISYKTGWNKALQNAENAIASRRIASTQKEECDNMRDIVKKYR